MQVLYISYLAGAQGLFMSPILRKIGHSITIDYIMQGLEESLELSIIVCRHRRCASDFNFSILMATEKGWRSR